MYPANWRRPHERLMNIDELQRTVWEVIRQPLTKSDGMKRRLRDGRMTRKIAEAVVKPNDRLTSFERLEIYNRLYWFRILWALAEDFPGLRAIVGERQFERLAVAYLAECPSESFTLRDLGARLPAWLAEHPEYAEKVQSIAMDMARLEWAEVEAFDGAEFRALGEADLRGLGEDPILHFQPHMQLLDLAYPVDDLLLNIRHDDGESEFASNAVTERRRRTKLRHSSLPKPEELYVAVYRLDNSVYFKRLEAEAFVLLRALLEGKPLSEGIEACVGRANGRIEGIAEQLHGWFANWASLKWFCCPPEERP